MPSPPRMPATPDPRQNHLLAALPEDEYARLLPHLQLAPMPLGEALYESGIQMRHVYFLSLIHISEPTRPY